MKRDRTVFVQRALLAGLILLLVPFGAPWPFGAPRAHAQFGRTAIRPEVVNVFLPAPREIRLKLADAELAISEGRYSDAVTGLGDILQNSEAEDYFLGSLGEEGAQTSVKAEAHRLLARMPAQGRQQYELQFGTAARQMLEDAVATGDLQKLTDITRMYFHTEAGHAATMLLARYRLDEGRPLAAALCLKRLADTSAGERYEPQLSFLMANCWLMSGQRATAEKVLLELKRKWPRATVRVGGRDLKWFDDDRQAIAWLEENAGVEQKVRHGDEAEWLVYRGDPARNGSSRGALPMHELRWMVPTANDADDDKLVKELADRYRNRNVPAQPAFQPLAAGDYILMRTPDRLLAVDFRTGKRTWEFPWFESPYRGDGTRTRTNPSGSQVREAQLNERLWDDAAYGQFSSDGELVFVLDKLDFAAPNRSNNGRVFVQRQMRGMQTSPSNELVALDLQTQGKLRWIVGGDSGGDEPKLAGAFFLGPPLPLLGQLYVLAEFTGGEIRLVVLDSRNGRLEWAQQLALLEGQQVTFDPGRRLAGATPSFADGVLVCPTSAGALVAVDLGTRSLMWGYQYKQFGYNHNARMRGIVTTQQRSAGNRWEDATVCIAEGRVLATPVESDQLLCLDLLTGKSAWDRSVERGDMLYVACVHKGRAVLVGKNSVRALDLKDGTSPWETQLEAMPAGRGFVSDDCYFLATSKPDVVKIDLNDGRIISRVETVDQTGELVQLGNLICYKDDVISHGPQSLAAFSQEGVLRKKVQRMLAANPNDPEALTLQGKLLFDDGHLVEAIASARKAFEKSPQDAREKPRGLLARLLLTALEDDFAAHRELADEAASVVEGTEQQGQYLRLMAAGLQNAGELEKSFHYYLELAALEPETGEIEKPQAIMEQPGPGWQVRRRRWVQTRLGELLAAASDSQRQAMQAAIEDRLQQATAAEGTAPLRRFIDYFGSQPYSHDKHPGDIARLRLAERLIKADDLLEAELLLAALQSRHLPETAATAAALHCRLVERAGQMEAAAAEYRELAQKWGDAVCLDGKTGRQIVDGLDPQSRLGLILARGEKWDPGLAIASAGSNATGTAAPTPATPVELRWEGVAGSQPLTLEINYGNRQDLLVKDARGVELAKIPLGGPVGRFPGNTRNIYQAKAVGHLLMISTGSEVIAVDALEAIRHSDNPILWHRSLALVDDGKSTVSVRSVNRVNLGDQRFVAANAVGQLLGALGPCGRRGVCFQIESKLVCLDPLTGDEIWIRNDLPVGCELFGDDELLILVRPNTREATVYGTADGRELGTRELGDGQLWETYGRNLLTSEQRDGQVQVRLRDVWSGKDLLTASAHGDTKGTVVEHEELALLEPDGKFSLYSLADGKLRFSAQLEAEPRLESIHVLRFDDQYLLMANRPTIVDPRRNTGINALPRGFRSPLVSGRLYAFDRRTGSLQWPVPAVIEQYGLPLDQPSASPLVVFMRLSFSTTRGARRPRTSEVLCLDRRDGRLVFSEEFPSDTTAWTTQADLDQQTVQIRTNTRNWVVRMTRQPAPPAPPAQIEVGNDPNP